VNTVLTDNGEEMVAEISALSGPPYSAPSAGSALRSVVRAT
jgi:hypothetical protein